MLAADADFQVRTRLAPALGRHLADPDIGHHGHTADSTGSGDGEREGIAQGGGRGNGGVKSQLG